MYSQMLPTAKQKKENHLKKSQGYLYQNRHAFDIFLQPWKEDTKKDVKICEQSVRDLNVDYNAESSFKNEDLHSKYFTAFQ